MKRIFSLGVILLIICGLIWVSCQKKVEEKVVKIGAILPLTGDAAQWGIPPLKGAQLAIDEINSKGGIRGRLLKLLPQDTKCDPKEGVSAFNKLLSVDKTKIIIGAVCSSVTLAVAPIAEKNEVLLISPASTNPKITEAGDYVFRVIPSDTLRGKVFAEYLFKNEGFKKVGIIYINNDGGRGNRDAFKERFEGLGGKIVIEETYDPEAIDMRTQLPKIKHADIEALMVVSYPRDTVLLLKQAKEIGLNKPLYFQTEAVEDPHVLRETKGAAEGIIYILPASASGKIPEEFVRHYESRYEIKPELFAAEAYDIINLIAKAIKKTDSTDPTKLKEYLYTIKNYQGASGIITFDKNGDVLKPMAIKMIINGKPKLITVIKPLE